MSNYLHPIYKSTRDVITWIIIAGDKIYSTIIGTLLRLLSKKNNKKIKILWFVYSDCSRLVLSMLAASMRRASMHVRGKGAE